MNKPTYTERDIRDAIIEANIAPIYERGNLVLADPDKIIAALKNPKMKATSYGRLLCWWFGHPSYTKTLNQEEFCTDIKCTRCSYMEQIEWYV